MSAPKTLLALHRAPTRSSLAGDLRSQGLEVAVSTNMAETWSQALRWAPEAVILAPMTRDPDGPEIRSLLRLAADPNGPAVLVMTEDPDFLETHAQIIDDFLPPDTEPREVERRLRFAVARRAALAGLHSERDTLLQQTITDFKTGLFNDRYFSSRCREECSRAQRQEQVLGLLMIDFDDFKGINDASDHAFGDHVLRIFARTLKGRLRDFDVPARLGGDEFGVLLPNTRLEDALTIAERLCEAIEDLHIEDRGHTTTLTISVGAASWNPTGKRSFDEELKGADRALLDAKKRGRNRICRFDGKIAEHGVKPAEGKARKRA